MKPGAIVLDRYLLHEEIGAGGMGVVWRATDQLLQQEIALKRVSFADLKDEQARLVRDRTLREARLAAQLRDHPNVIAVYDVLLDDGDIWLVMEYLPSRSLHELIQAHHRLDPRLVSQIGVHVANALAAGHARGIEHRDIKPGNVLIGTDGTIKLTDYGISHLSGDPHLTQSAISGTPAYLAPEVAAGGESSPSSDVFSLGATLYTAVEGEPPFGVDDNALRLLNVVRTGVIRPLTHAGALEPLLMRLLQINPSARPDATTARDLLAKLTIRLPEPDGRTRLVPRPRWRPSRRRIVITIGAGLAVAATSLVIGMSLRPTPAALPSTTTSPAGDSDGSFETPQIAAYTIATVGGGQSIGAWTVTRGNVDLIGSSYWSAAQGAQSVDLNGFVDGAIVRSLSTHPGRTYVVEFALAGNPDGAPSVKTGRASVNGQPVMDLSFDTTGKSRSQMGYQIMRFSFTASRAQTTIEFMSTSGTACGLVIDDVRVTPASP